jgi:cysteine-rich repeat protein
LSEHWDVTESAGTLRVSTDYYGPYAGNIDEGTGAFSIDPGQPYPLCGTNSVQGSVAADGLTFTGTQELHIAQLLPGPAFECLTHITDVSGSRCGNQQLDDGEDCDDGNQLDGDCCSSSCTYDPPATACTDDLDVCTDDKCDGAGVCEHIDNTAACSDPAGCGSGNCNAGSCVISAPEPVGTSCDKDASVCTPDTCDGSGVCVAGDPIDCSPCGYCSPLSGCVGPGSDPCDRADKEASISVRLDSKGTRQQVSALLEDFAVPQSSLGDPTTSTDYTLCLYQSDSGDGGNVIFRGTVPADGMCGTKPCWTLTGNNGFVYKDRAGSADGIGLVKATLGGGFRFRGKGENLALPDLFPDNITLSAKIVARDGATTTGCWYRAAARERQSLTSYKGSSTGG